MVFDECFPPCIPKWVDFIDTFYSRLSSRRNRKICRGSIYRCFNVHIHLVGSQPSSVCVPIGLSSAEQCVIHRVLGLVRQMHATVLHLCSPRIAVRRTLPRHNAQQ
jgi:hypothetical protein